MQNVLKGQWKNGIEWEIFLSDEVPSAELVTAVFCVAITQDGKILLARSQRGWGLLGGHIETGETMLEALMRESHEEGGFVPANPHQFAVMKVNPTKPILRPDSASYYPYPTSYQVYYWSTTNESIAKPTGSEIIEAKSFTLTGLERLDLPDLPIIKLGYEIYQRSKQLQ